MSRLISVSAVSYLNTAPFVYGLQHSEIANHINLTLDHPADCARNLLLGKSQVALVPVFAVIDNPKLDIVTNFCIGSNGLVRTVSLLTNTALEKVKTVYLDNHSRTSAALVKVLAKRLWHIDIAWKVIDVGTLSPDIIEGEAILAIGDKVFDLERRFAFNIDLAIEWNKLTGLPMVFACWVTGAGIKLPDSFLNLFNDGLQFGIDRIENVSRTVKHVALTEGEILNYFKNNISYDLNALKREGLNMFWDYAREFK